MKLNLKTLKDSSYLRLLTFILSFAVVGGAFIVISRAASTNILSGIVFEDTNKNSVQDTGEPAMTGHQLYLFDSNWQIVKSVLSDSAGGWKFDGLADGDYFVTSDSTSWDTVADRLVPENSGSLRPEWTVRVVGNTTQPLIWRPIIRSTTQGQPISSVTAPDGMRVESYVDVVTADQISQSVHEGLVGPEAPNVKVIFGLNDMSISAISAGTDSTGKYNFYSANVYVSYSSWLRSPVQNTTLSHEYGHAWSSYHAYITQQDPTFSAYLRFRGLENHPKLNTSHAWNATEMIAEDYRQLLGSPAAQAGQENSEIPLAKDVAGLKEFLSGTYAKNTSDGTATSIVLTGAVSGSNSVQLNWSTTDSSAVSQYEVYRNSVKVGFVNAPSTTYFDTSLSPNTAYTYYVRALYASGGSSEPSNILQLTTPPADTTAPTAPTNFRSTNITSSSVSLAWSASTDNVSVSSYRLYRLDRNKRVLVASVSGTSRTVSGLSKNKSYTFLVTAVDSSGNESTPAQLTVKTPSR